MKISLSHHWKQDDKKRGFKKFAALLLRELQDNFDIQIVPESKSSDIHLTMIHGRQKKGAKNILRIDGVYYDRGRLNMNNPIKNSIRTFDAVVFQSKWCQKFATGMLKVKPKASAVIYNGCGQDYGGVTVDKRGFDKVFICCANWRVNKRLKAITKSFLEARERSSENWGLFVLGNPDYNVEEECVKYFGHVNDLDSIYKSSDYMCHICHLDACPNSVVEGLSAGLPVLSNNIGGTPEIVGDSGIILDIDKPFDFKPINVMKDVGSKSVDQRVIVEGMLEMSRRDWEIDRKDLHISKSAENYYKLFKSVLGK